VQQHSQPVGEVSRAPLAGDRETGDQVGGEQPPEQLRRAGGGPGLGEDPLAGEPLGDPAAGGELVGVDLGAVGGRVRVGIGRGRAGPVHGEDTRVIARHVRGPLAQRGPGIRGRPDPGE